MAREEIHIERSPQEAFCLRRKFEGRVFEALFWGMPPPDPDRPIIQSVPSYVGFEEALRLVEARQLSIPNWNPYDPKIGLAAKLFPLVAREASIKGLMLLNAMHTALDQYHHADGVFFLRSPRTYLAFDLTISHYSLVAKNGRSSPAECLIRPWSLEDEHIGACAKSIADRFRKRVEDKRMVKRLRRQVFDRHEPDDEYVGERV